VLTLHILGREIIAIRWRTAAPAPAANNGSGLGGAFERGPAATAIGRQFGFKL